MVKERKTSITLGIIGIVSSLFSPLIGITLGIIGLSIKKPNNEKLYKKAITLNTIAIVIGIINWIIAMFIIMDSIGSYLY